MSYKLSSPQKRICESDLSIRKSGRDPDPTRYYINLIRTGKISLTDLSEAAVLGDEIARKVAENFGEDPPSIESFSDIINIFITREDHRNIAFALFQNLDKSFKVIFNLSHNPNVRDVDLEVALIRLLNRISPKYSLKEILDIIRPYLVAPELRQSNIYSIEDYMQDLFQRTDLSELL